MAGQLDDWRQRAKAHAGKEVGIASTGTETSIRPGDVGNYVQYPQVNCPPGLARNSFSVLKWRFDAEEGLWLVLKMRSMTGLVVEEATRGHGQDD